MAFQFNEDSIRKIAQLARLELNRDEISKFSAQLEKILDYVNKLNTVDTSNVEPMTHALATETPLRADDPRPGVGTEKMLSSAPEQLYENYKVPQVLGGE